MVGMVGFEKGNQDRACPAKWGSCPALVSFRNLGYPMCVFCAYRLRPRLRSLWLRPLPLRTIAKWLSSVWATCPLIAMSAATTSNEHGGPWWGLSEVLVPLWFSRVRAA
eukprot:1159584-Pelagomonas_calceolata.AAC.3